MRWGAGPKLLPGRERPTSSHSSLQGRSVELFAEPLGYLLGSWRRCVLGVPGPPLLSNGGN